MDKALSLSILFILLIVNRSVCQNQCGDNTMNSLDILQSELNDNESRDKDVVIILDRSPSLADQRDLANEIIRLYMSYVTLNCRADISPDADHVALVPFGIQSATITRYVYDGITNTAESGVCPMVEFIDTIPDGTEPADTHYTIIDALTQAQALLQPNNDTRYQTILIFYDGEVASSFALPDGPGQGAFDQELFALTDTLKGNEVSIFTVGIGDWLDDPAELGRLQSMATPGHFACADTWRQLLSSAMPGAPVYSPADTCSSTCDATQQCACDVTTTDTTCQEPSDLECQPSPTTIQATTPTPNPSSPASDPPNPDTPVMTTRGPSRTPSTSDQVIERALEPEDMWYEESWFYYAVGGAAGGMLLVTMVIIVCCCCCPVCCCYAGGDKDSKEEDVEFGNIQVEWNMEGWGAHLMAECSQQGLLHLGVYDFTGNYWARTCRLDVSHDQVKVIESLHKGENSGDFSSNITVSDAVYMLAKVPEERRHNVWFGKVIQDLHIDSSSLKKRNKHNKPEDKVMWINIVQQYVIIGVAGKSKSDICKKTVCGLGAFFVHKARSSSIYANKQGSGGGLNPESIDFAMNGEIFSELPDREYFSYLEMQGNNMIH